MKIEIGKNLVITSDQHQFILSEKKTVKEGARIGAEILLPIGYYPKLSQLINGLIQKGVRGSAINSLNAMNNEIERIAKLCEQAFEVNHG